jgi:uncharacterized repeat protein (TIGR03803 family)
MKMLCAFACCTLVSCGGGGEGTSASSRCDAQPNGANSTAYATVTLLYCFQYQVNGSLDGARPNNVIQASDGNLYGTTFAGGAGNGEASGTVYRVTLGGAETILHSFGLANPGANPGPLIQASDGNFYGVGQNVGLFRVNPSGDTAIDIYPGFSDSVNVIQARDSYLYTGVRPPFAQSAAIVSTGGLVVDFPAGSAPAGVTQGRDGNLYGTEFTDWGPTGARSLASGVYEVTLSTLQVHTLYQFTGSNDAVAPIAPLLEASDGNFYGTSHDGGANGGGVVYRVSPAGVETVLHSFGQTPEDGEGPSGPLIEGADGDFYGVTQSGGSGRMTCSIEGNRCGTVYRITSSGAVTILYSFGNYPSELGNYPGDGAFPTGALVQASDGAFYGVTQIGGIGNVGTVFKMVLTP